MSLGDGEEHGFLQPEDGDWLLVKIVSLLNERGGAMDVTLTVAGLLISGEMIGGAEYFALLGEGFADSQFSEFGARLYTSDEINPTPAFLHMKNAVVVCGDHAVPDATRGMLWRGRIAAVDGFAWGRVAAAREAG